MRKTKKKPNRRKEVVGRKPAAKPSEITEPAKSADTPPAAHPPRPNRLLLAISILLLTMWLIFLAAVAFSV